jgi:steroid 5-alpha reductase family enzyme
MNNTKLRSIITFVVITLIGYGVAVAGSQNGTMAFGLPLFGLLVGLIYLIQWVAFIPAYTNQTEKFFDLTGSLTYISVSILALIFSPNLNSRSILLAILVIVWAGRLGTFLYRRIQKDGKDGRFDEIKPNFLRFLNVWTIQALWVTFTAAAAFIAISASNEVPLGILAIIGLLVWIAGFAIEAMADYQKSQFKADPKNKGKFIDVGLWSKSRHPNYFGEIVLWIGVAIIAYPVLQGWQLVGLISPIFVTLLLTKVSGVPMLENRADEKWGGQADYEAYKKNTPVLIPKL